MASFETHFLPPNEDEDEIQKLEGLLKNFPEKHETKTFLLGRLANLRRKRFDLLGRFEDLDAAIEYERRVISATPDEHPSKSDHLRELSVSYYIRCHRLGELADIGKAIESGIHADILTPQDHLDKLTGLNILAACYQRRFDHKGDLEDSSKAIEYSLRAVSLAPEDHPDLPGWLANLGVSYRRLFERLGDGVHLDNAVKYGLRSVQLTPEGHRDQPGQLSKLGNAYQARFRSNGELADLDQAVNYFSQAVLLTDDSNPEKPCHLDGLGSAYVSRFERLGRIEDIDAAVNYKSRAALLIPNNHPNKPGSLKSLGASYHTRFRRQGDLVDLQKSIEHLTQSVTLTPDSHPFKPNRLSSLGDSYQSRFERLGDLADLESAIDYKFQAVHLTPTGHANKPVYLSALGIAYRLRFQRCGVTVDIDKAINCLADATSLSPDSHTTAPGYMVILGSLYRYRFERLGELADIDQAIEHEHRAVVLTPDDHYDKPTWKSNLGISYRSRFERFGNLADINTAIDYQLQAVAHTLDNDVRKVQLLGSLGNSYHTRFEHLGEIEDLDQAIGHLNRALILTPNDHPSLFAQLAHLHQPYFSRFRAQGNRADIEKAIEYQSKAASLIPNGHAFKCTVLKQLGALYESRLESAEISADIDKAVECFKASANSSTSSPVVGLQASRSWARLCLRYHRSPLEAYDQAIALIPQVAWLGSSVARRYQHLISDIQSLATEAAAAAIVSQEYILALQWLEAGRSIVWNQMLQLRTPLDVLSAQDPTLADELQKAAVNLEQASSFNPSRYLERLDSIPPEQAAQQHRRLAEQWETLLLRIRCLPGFEDFLALKKLSRTALSNISSTVVVVNVYQEQCDALVMTHEPADLVHIPLPAFSHNKALNARDNIISMQNTRTRTQVLRRPVFHDAGLTSNLLLEDVLGILWKDVVQPVLGGLGYLVGIWIGGCIAIVSYDNDQKSSKMEDELPHITWCATGVLASLPLHAAGVYNEGSKDRAFDYVVSSYTPTLGALLPQVETTPEFPGILAVGEAAARTTLPLPGTVAELDQLERLAKGIPFTRLDESRATCEAVLSEMERHSWVHLACHASQDVSDPTASAFQLHDGPLTLALITRKSLKHARFAFLSACETATGDKQLPDEAVHLAAGMIMAGYRTVIATMWSIKDQDAPLVSEKLYAHLLEGGAPQNDKAARALHKAVGCLRSTMDEKEFERWVPYIHMGL